VSYIAALLLEDHLDHCVKEALQNQERADEKMGT
jgi:DNA-binding FrmR family transcriptional regulator